MEEENDISEKFVKRKKPDVPADFFKNFYAGLKEEMDAIDPFETIILTKRQRPVRPGDGTPWSLNIEPVAPAPVKRGRVIRLGVISFASAVAATVAVLLYMNREQEIAIPTIAEVSIVKPAESEGELDTYIAYLDEEEMIDYIIENEIGVGNEMDDDVYDIVESDLEDIYLDL